MIVTNGRTAQQESKIRNTGLNGLVRGWAVSESVGHKKPAPEIFRAAAALVALPLADAWIIGDSPRADIAGAVTPGLRSVWAANGRSWNQDACRHTYAAADVAAAIHHAIRADSGKPTA